MMSKNNNCRFWVIFIVKMMLFRHLSEVYNLLSVLGRRHFCSNLELLVEGSRRIET